MKNILGKVIVAASALLVFSQGANASSTEYSGFYAVPKVVVVIGEKITHHGHELDGDNGVGIGLDIGYSFTKNYAVEMAFTHAKVDIVEDGHIYDEAEYTTYGVMGVYSRTIFGHLRGLVKLGYAWEYEKMDKLHIKETLSGIAYSAGLEYGISDNMEVVLEFECCNVISSRGNGLMLGLKYKF